MDRQYTSVLCGLGGISWRFGSGPDGDPLCHGAAMEQHSSCRLVAGCSPSTEDRTAFQGAYDLPTFSGLDDMLADIRPDMVSICSPTDVHFEQVRSCIEQGVPMIWLEKPPAKTGQEVRELVELQREHGGRSTVVVNYQRRYVQSSLRLKKILRDEAFGKVVRVTINYSRALNVNGVHFLDLLFFLFDDELDYALEWVSTKRGTTSPSFVMTTAGGVEIVVQGDGLDYHNNDVIVTFERGRLSILHGGSEVLVEERVENELFPGYYRLRNTDSACLEPAGFQGAFTAALDDLVRSHEAGVAPLSSLHTALQSQLLVDECLSRCGG